MALMTLTDSEVFKLHILEQDPHDHRYVTTCLSLFFVILIRALRRPFGGVNPHKSGFSALVDQFMEATAEEDEGPKKGKGAKPSKKYTKAH